MEKKQQHNNPAKNHRYYRTQCELPPGSSFHMLRSADDLTPHVTRGDRAHSWGRSTAGGLRAHSFQGVRTEADLLTRHWDHFRASCQSVSQSSLLEMHPSSITAVKPHRHWDSFVKQNTPMCEQFYLCMLLFFPICFFSAVYHFLKIELKMYSVCNAYISASKKNATNKKQVKF